MGVARQDARTTGRRFAAAPVQRVSIWPRWPRSRSTPSSPSCGRNGRQSRSASTTRGSGSTRSSARQRPGPGSRPARRGEGSPCPLPGRRRRVGRVDPPLHRRVRQARRLGPLLPRRRIGERRRSRAPLDALRHLLSDDRLRWLTELADCDEKAIAKIELVDTYGWVKSVEAKPQTNENHISPPTAPTSQRSRTRKVAMSRTCSPRRRRSTCSRP